MASSSSDGDDNPQHDWEYSKENAAPLEYGRSTKVLSKRAFGTSTAELSMIEEKTKKYERLVQRSEKAVEWLQKQTRTLLERSDGDVDTNDEGAVVSSRELTDNEAQSLRERMVLELGFDPSTTDRDNVDYDPLRYWVLYIKHIRDAYPSDSQRQFLVMERCARTFMARPFVIPTYINDVRFVRTCILYADKSSNPSDVFKLMGKIKVGTKVALFWVAWAWVAEKAQDFPFTEKIFQKALSVNAEPRAFLDERQKQFVRRMSRHWLNASQAQDGEDGLDGDNDEDGRRGALNSLSSEGVARNDRGGGGGGSATTSNRHTTTNQQSGNPQQQQHQRKKGNGTMVGGFNIFQDGGTSGPVNVLDDDEHVPGRQLLATERERSKENSMRPEHWNEREYGLNDHPATDIGRPPPFGGHSRSGSAAAFDVFIDEDLKEDVDVTIKENNDEKIIDQRSLRQRLDGGAADRLTRDPLRYMRNPSKIESDLLKYDASPVDAVANVSNAPMPFPNVKLSVDSDCNPEPERQDRSGDERCYEERRLNRRYFTLVSGDCDFNLLKREDCSVQNNNSSLMDIEESLIEEEEESIEEVNMEDITEDVVIRPIKSVLKSSLRTAKNTPPIHDENTGLMNPRRVLFGANTNVVFPTESSVNTSTASSQLNGSFIRAEETINTKLAKVDISMMFSSPNANVSLAETPGDEELFHGESNHQAGSLNYSNFTGYSIYQDDSVDEKKAAKVSTGLSFAVHDENKRKSDRLASWQGRSERRPPPAPESRSSGEDTASLSIIGNVLDCLGDDESKTVTYGDDSKSTLMGVGIYVDSETSPKQMNSKTTYQNLRTSVARGTMSKEMKKVVDDTADLSLIDGVMSSIKNCPVTKPGFGIYSDDISDTKRSSKDPSGFKVYNEDVNAKQSAGKSTGLGFEVFSDDVISPPMKARRCVNAEPSFGDISRIEDEKTSHFHIMDENADEILSKNYEPIVYERRHKEDMESAMRKCMTAAAKSCDIFDSRRSMMPKALLRQSFTAGTKIDLPGGETLTIANELGRGVYGVVLLCRDEKGQSDALKIQAPIGSLAHEYSILLLVEDRIQPQSFEFYPFPRSRALHAFKEGGVFSMTAGSESGMTLIDVVNTYKKLTGNVPELIAIYYTSRMLEHLESLHQNGRVLHCDIKPDNWVLATSNNEKYDHSHSVGGADLMLVDFGRAIDLDKTMIRGSDPLYSQFTGNIAAEDMECGAMREGRRWGVDLDFFGLAASSYLLLFGSHMEVVQERSTGKWRPYKSFRRYWQCELWGLLFDSLLNFDSSTDKYCLQEIRAHFDDYIMGKNRKKEIASNLQQLHTHLR